MKDLLLESVALIRNWRKCCRSWCRYGGESATGLVPAAPDKLFKALCWREFRRSVETNGSPNCEAALWQASMYVLAASNHDHSASVVHSMLLESYLSALCPPSHGGPDEINRC